MRSNFLPRAVSVFAWSVASRITITANRPDPARSGDLVVLLKKDITPIPDTTRYVATHGSPWDYDRRVPILFWRKGMAPVASEAAVETTDIMPTLAATLGLPLAPGSVDGRCLAQVAQCPAAAPAPPERGK